MLSSKHIVILGLICAAPSLQAEESTKANWKIKAKVRGDAVQSSTKTTYGSADSSTANSSEVKLTRAQFEFIGTKGDSELRIKYYGDKNELKYGFVSHNFTPMFSMAAGKIDARDFSWEWDYSTTDEYIFSRSGTYGIENVPGIEGKLNLGDHQFYVQALQGATVIAKNKTDISSSSGNLTTSIQYRGDFMDHMIQPLITYANVRTAESKFTITDSNTKAMKSYNYGNGYQTHLGVGVKFLIAGTNSDIEYDMANTMKQKDVDTSKAIATTSIVAQTRLQPISDFTPYVKIISDTEKLDQDNNKGDIARMAYALGTEYALKPSIRVHLIATMENSTTKLVTDPNDSKNIGDKKIAGTGFNMGVTASM
jgi:hypothetical protein